VAPPEGQAAQPGAPNAKGDYKKRLEGMTPEEREAAKNRYQNMTPAERDAARQRRQRRDEGIGGGEVSSRSPGSLGAFAGSSATSLTQLPPCV